MDGQRNGYQYIYCLPPAGGRIRSQGNYYCLPPAGGRIRSQGNYYCLPPAGGRIAPKVIIIACLR
jgi:hypothetical protein